MSVVGFDIGNQNCYIAVARQGGVETATNDYSQRATPTCVSFGQKSRCMGVAARQQVATNVKNTVLSFKNLIGRRFDDPVVQAERKYVPYELVELPDHRIGIKVMYLSEHRVFTPEQILAIMLTKLKDIAESYLKTKVSDCVISIPCYWTDAQRRAVIDASKIVDLNCLRIINETTSVALTYGIYKQDLPEEAEKPRRVVFVDVGHSATQVSACAFNKGKLKMLGTVWDMTLGGRDFDNVLVDFFTEEFKKKYKIDAKSNVRALFRLTDECEKMKKQMSANSNQIPLNIECFMNDKDVSGVTKRSDFEEMSKHIWEKFKTLLNRLLTETKMKPADVDSIELVGGGSRMPLVRQIVQQVFGKDPATTLNQDEAVSRGSALQCAMLSPTFRVREFNVTDVQPFAIKLNWKAVSGLDDGEMEVFNEHHAFPFSKMLTFYRKEPFVLEASYAYPNHIPFSSTYIGRFLVNNVVPGPDGDNSKIKVKVRINGNGIFAVTSASMYESQQITEDEQQEQSKAENEPMDTQNDPAVSRNGENPMESANNSQPEPMQAEAQNEPQVNNQQTPPPGADVNMDDKQPQQNEIPAKQQQKQKIKIKCIDLPIAETVAQMSDEEIRKFRSMELELQKQDRFEREKADAKNAVEEYVYEMRNELNDKLANFVSEDEKSKFIKFLEETENWIYEDGEDQPKDVYLDKMNQLKKFGDPIWKRYNDVQEQIRAQLQAEQDKAKAQAEAQAQAAAQAQAEANKPAPESAVD